MAGPLSVCGGGGTWAPRPAVRNGIAPTNLRVDTVGASPMLASGTVRGRPPRCSLRGLAFAQYGEP
jgi:hypothetical protein